MTVRSSPQVTDALVAVAFVALAVVEGATSWVDDGFLGGPRWLNVTLGVLTCATLAWRRWAPEATYLVMLALIGLPGLVTAHSLYVWSTLFPLCLAVYTVARAGDGWVARTG